MDKQKLLMNMFKAVGDTREISEKVDKSFEELSKRNRPRQQRFTICCKVKELNKELARLEPELKRIFN